MSLLQTLAILEDNNDLHLGRLLLLLGVFAGANGRGTIDGLTKLAKLDFLLRYPTFLERALHKRGAPYNALKVSEIERQSVESRMVRFKYGPWDFRYRKLANILVGKGLAHIETHGRTIVIGLTPDGMRLAAEIATTGPFRDYEERARLLKRHLDLSATNLMRFIYDTFPEVVSLRLGEEINV